MSLKQILTIGSALALTILVAPGPGDRLVTRLQANDVPGQPGRPGRRVRPKGGQSVVGAWRSTLNLRACRTRARVLPQHMRYVLDAVITVHAGRSLGSGVILNNDGYAVTAAHVVKRYRRVRVRFRSGRMVTAKVLRRDFRQDTALLKLAGRGYRCLKFASRPPGLGMRLYAVGAPVSAKFSHTISRGIVSAYRKMYGFSYIQTDASISPGNSGGPLLNQQAQIAGIVRSKLVGRGIEGIAFGVPPAAFQKTLCLRWAGSKRQACYRASRRFRRAHRGDDDT